jgi:hypothetical protein
MARPFLRVAEAEPSNSTFNHSPLTQKVMQFSFWGQLTGSRCNVCSIPFTHGIVRLYQQVVSEVTLTHVAAPP